MSERCDTKSFILQEHEVLARSKDSPLLKSNFVLHRWSRLLHEAILFNSNSSACFDPLRTALPCSGMDLLFQPLQPRSSRSFSATACFGTATVRCCALPHRLGTTPHRSFPRLNLHNDRVRRNHGRLPSSRCIESARTHHARVCALPFRASDTTLRLLAHLVGGFAMDRHRIE